MFSVLVYTDMAICAVALLCMLYGFAIWCVLLCVQSLPWLFEQRTCELPLKYSALCEKCRRHTDTGVLYCYTSFVNLQKNRSDIPLVHQCRHRSFEMVLASCFFPVPEPPSAENCQSVLKFVLLPACILFRVSFLRITFVA